MSRSSDLTLVTLVNDADQFAQCQGSLRRHASRLPAWISIDANSRNWNAATALNRVLDDVATSWVACVHQDVLFSSDWPTELSRILGGLASDVAVLGLVGTRRDGRFRGHVRDPNGLCYWGPLPAEVLTIDEHAILLRTASALRFDPRIPGFHCYGADMCLQARERGWRVMVVDAPVTHVSTGTIDDTYESAAGALLEKWGERYDWVLPTPPRLLFDPNRAPLSLRLVHRWRRLFDDWNRNPRSNGGWTLGS